MKSFGFECRKMRDWRIDELASRFGYRSERTKSVGESASLWQRSVDVAREVGVERERVHGHFRFRHRLLGELVGALVAGGADMSEDVGEMDGAVRILGDVDDGVPDGDAEDVLLAAGAFREHLEHAEAVGDDDDGDGNGRRIVGVRGDRTVAAEFGLTTLLRFAEELGDQRGDLVERLENTDSFKSADAVVLLAFALNDDCFIVHDVAIRVADFDDCREARCGG